MRRLRNPLPLEDFVPVRKASEALDGVVMELCPAGQFLVLRCLVKPERSFLIDKIFAVLEGKIKKRAFGQFNLAIEAVLDRPLRRGKRKHIGRESARGAAKHV